MVADDLREVGHKVNLCKGGGKSRAHLSRIVMLSKRATDSEKVGERLFHALPGNFGAAGAARDRAQDRLRMVAQRERGHRGGGGKERARKALPLRDDLLHVRLDESGELQRLGAARQAPDPLELAPHHRVALAGAPLEARGPVLEAAVEAVWRLIVQHEACDCANHSELIERYRIPPEVLSRVGALKWGERQVG